MGAVGAVRVVGSEETERWGTVSDGVEKREKRQAAGRARGGVGTRSVH